MHGDSATRAMRRSAAHAVQCDALPRGGRRASSPSASRERGKAYTQSRMRQRYCMGHVHFYT